MSVLGFSLHFAWPSRPRSLRAPGALALLAVVVTLAAPGSALAEGRIALVIGNAAYEEVAPLRNAARDAEDVAAALDRIGFEVTLVTDAPRAGLAPVLEDFATRAETAEAVLFYYSGHAFQQGGDNRLVPADARLRSAEALEAETWSFSEIVARLSDEDRQTLFFLDACRNDPLPLTLRDAISGEGLAKPDTGTGSFVAFATQPGAVARDGVGDNSPFTAAMLGHVETPGISISDMMIRVRNDVVEATGETQVPWDQSSLRAQFYFVPDLDQGAELTDADLAAIGGLDEDSIRNVVGALAQNGVTLEILVVEDEEAEPGEVIAAPIVEIEDVDDAPAGEGEEVAMLEDDTRSIAPEQDAAANDTAGEAVDADDAPTLAEQVATAEAESAGADPAAAGPTEAELAAIELPENLALGVQQELSRVGCHRAAVDGIWGKISRISLLRYYTAKGSVSAEEAQAAPTEAAFRRLALEPGVVCEGVVAPPVRVAAANTGSQRTRVVVKEPAAASGSGGSGGGRVIRSEPTTTSSGQKVPARINRARPGVFR